MPDVFCYGFRELRQRVHRQLSPELADLHASKAKIRQWDAFWLIFLVLTVSWARLLLTNSGELRRLWLALTVLVGLVICWLWQISRGATRLET